MTISLLSELVEEIARDHGFDAERLRVALVRAVEAHEEERSFWNWREQVTSQIGAIEPVLIAAGRALQRWQQLPAKVRHEVACFVNPSDGTDPIGPKLNFVADLLKEYRDHYSWPRGNPGLSRTREDGDNLDPLREFSAILMAFWDGEKGTPFGHVVERQTDLPGVDPNNDRTAPRDAKSAAMRFLYEAGAVLHPTGYTISNFETVVRDIKRNSRRA